MSSTKVKRTIILSLSINRARIDQDRRKSFSSQRKEIQKVKAVKISILRKRLDIQFIILSNTITVRYTLINRDLTKTYLPK